MRENNRKVKKRTYRSDKTALRCFFPKKVPRPFWAWGPEEEGK